MRSPACGSLVVLGIRIPGICLGFGFGLGLGFGLGFGFGFGFGFGLGLGASVSVSVSASSAIAASPSATNRASASAGAPVPRTGSANRINAARNLSCSSPTRSTNPSPASRRTASPIRARTTLCATRSSTRRLRAWNVCTSPPSPSTATSCPTTCSRVTMPPRSTDAGSRYNSASACPTIMSPTARCRRGKRSPLGNK